MTEVLQARARRTAPRLHRRGHHELTRWVGALYGYANLVIEACWLILAALVPLYIDALRLRTEFPKELFFELITVSMALLWLTQRVAARWAEPSAGAPLGSAPARYFCIAAVGFAVATLVAAWFSPLPDISFGGSYSRGGGAWATVGYIVLFLVVGDRLRTAAQLRRLLRVLLLASLPVCLYALLQAGEMDPLNWGDRDLTRVFGTLGNPPALAAYLSLLLPLTAWQVWWGTPARDPASKRYGVWYAPLVFGGAVALLAAFFAVVVGHQQGWWSAPALLAAFALLVALLPPAPEDGDGPLVRRVGYGALLILQLLVLVLTQTRGPIASIVIALLIVWCVVAAYQRQWRRLLLAASAFLVLGGLLLALNVVDSPLRSLTEQLPILRRLSSLTSGYSSGRFLVWRSGLAAFGSTQILGAESSEHDPLRWLVGYGPETIQYQLDRVLPPAAVLDQRVGEFWDRTHNELIDQLLTKGICGVVAYVALLGGIILYVLHRSLRSTARPLPGFGIALAIALLGYLIAVQVGPSGSGAMTVFWLLAGVAVGNAWVLWTTASTLPPSLDVQCSSTGSPGSRVARPREGAPPTLPGLAAFSVFLVSLAVVTLVLIALPAPMDVAWATGLQLLALGLAPFVGALALGGRLAGRWVFGLAVVLAAGILPVTLLVGQRQVSVLVADAAARRAQLAEPTSDFVAAIRATQDSIAFVPWEGEYYSLLGQYYGALAPRVSGPGVPDLAVSLSTALRLRQPAALTRDEVFDLGRVSLEAAIQRNPLDARFYTTLGQLYRYWDETAGTTTHLPAALAQFETAQRLKPNDVEAQVGAAATRLLAGDYADALQRASQAEALLPAYWYPYDVMAQAYMALRQYGAAYDAADTAIKRGAGWALGYKAPTRADTNRLTALRRNAADLAGIPLAAD